MIQIIATKPRIKLWTRYLNGYHISNRYILLLGFAGVPKNIINQSRYKYNKNYICQHSGLNRLVARLMFGSFNPKYEYFLEYGISSKPIETPLKRWRHRGYPW